MRGLSLFLAAALMALPAGADTPVDDDLPAEANPQCSLLSLLVVARHDSICTTAETTIQPAIETALQRYVDYSERNSTQPRHAIEAEINGARLQPAPADRDCVTHPAGIFHARFAGDPTGLPTMVDFHLAEDRPVAMDVSACFSEARN